MTHLLIALFLMSVALPAAASRDAGFEHDVAISPCELNDLQRAVLNRDWNNLARRFFMVSIEDAGDPYRINQVRIEVNQAVEDLRKEYGSDCVLDIL